MYLWLSNAQRTIFSKQPTKNTNLLLGTAINVTSTYLLAPNLLAGAVPPLKVSSTHCPHFKRWWSTTPELNNVDQLQCRGKINVRRVERGCSLHNFSFLPLRCSIATGEAASCLLELELHLLDRPDHPPSPLILRSSIITSNDGVHLCLLNLLLR